jgi:hypothetical protein
VHGEQRSKRGVRAGARPQTQKPCRVLIGLHADVELPFLQLENRRLGRGAGSRVSDEHREVPGNQRRDAGLRSPALISATVNCSLRPGVDI